MDEKNLVTLHGNTHPLARAKNDQGPAPDNMALHRMLLVLRRSAEQEAELKHLLEGQQDKTSPNYRQWLTPQQFGQQYGPAVSDVQAVTDWLGGHGFEVARVSAGGNVIEFSGSVAQVRAAFHTEIHKFVVNGEQHWANATDPQIPAALAPVVAGVASLHNFPKKAQVKKRGIFTQEVATGKLTPDFTFCVPSTTPCPAGSNTFFALGPKDFAKIYNLPAAFDGTGQTIAIVGDSEICTASSPSFSQCNGQDDVAAFRSIFGLSTANLPQVIVDGPDPGFNGDEIEGALDSQWSGAVAPGAKILFVIAQDTETSAGIDLAALHIVDNNLAAVVSESFGACEAGLGNAGNQFYSLLWGQAAAQGMTMIVSAGDSGSAGCDDENTENDAQFGTFVNGIASTPFNIAAGGTDFDVTLPTQATYPSTFWSLNPSPQMNPPATALSYIPETTWNDSCAQTGSLAPGTCTNISSSSIFFNIVAGSGGPSNCTVLNAAGTQCVGNNPKPAWQTTSGGVITPNDRARDIPDISLFASDGLITNSFYIICESDLSPNPAQGCNLSTPFRTFVGVGGTSSAAPAFAGMMALVNQNTGTRQGNANFVLYALAAAQSGKTCNSSLGPAGIDPTCIFNDVTKGNNSVPCVGATQNGPTQNCSTQVAGQIGVLNTNLNGTGTIAFPAATGYDLATGLGSLNASNLVSKWTSAIFTSTTTNLCISTSSAPVTPSTCLSAVVPTIAHGTPLFISASVAPTAGNSTDNISLVGNGGGKTFGIDAFTLSSGTVNSQSSILFPGGTYTVTAHYGGNSTGTTLFGGSDSSQTFTLTVTPQSSKLLLNLVGFDINGNPVITQSTPYGSAYILRADVTNGTTSNGLDVLCFNTAGFGVTDLPRNYACPTGTVTITDNGAPLDPAFFPGGVLALNSAGSTEDQPIQLPAGVHRLSATYSGDASYNAPAAGPTVDMVTITPAATITSITSSANSISPNQQVTLTATVSTLSSGVAPAGAVNFFANGTLIQGSPLITRVAGSANANASVTATLITPLSGTSPISVTASYVADSNYAGSTSAAVMITVTQPDFSVSVAPLSQATSPGNTVSFTVTITPVGGFASAVTPSCTGLPAVLTCSAFTPATITPGTTANNSATFMVTASSSAFLLPAPASPPTRPWSPLYLLWGLLLVLSSVALWLTTRNATPRHRQLCRYAALAGITLSLALGIAGCGGSGGGGGGTRAARTYTFTVTGTSGATSHMSPAVTLMVQ